MTATELRYRAVSGIGGRVLGALLGSVRFSTVGMDNYQREWDDGRAVIFILWHGRLLPLSFYHRSWNLVTLISASSDGEYIARIVQQWGYEVVRGSSSRGGGPAFRELVRHARAGRSVAVTPDGPRGPRERIKPGVILAAQITGCRIVPVAAAANRAWWIEGWDRFMVPQPFARICIAYGEPVFVPRGSNRNEIEGISGRLEAALSKVTLDAEAHVAS